MAARRLSSQVASNKVWWRHSEVNSTGFSEFGVFPMPAHACVIPKTALQRHGTFDGVCGVTDLAWHCLCRRRCGLLRLQLRSLLVHVS